jgi:hypothetical protein
MRKEKKYVLLELVMPLVRMARNQLQPELSVILSTYRPSCNAPHPIRPPSRTFTPGSPKLGRHITGMKRRLRRPIGCVFFGLASGVSTIGAFIPMWDDVRNLPISLMGGLLLLNSSLSPSHGQVLSFASRFAFYCLFGELFRWNLGDRSSFFWQLLPFFRSN